MRQKYGTELLKTAVFKLGSADQRGPRRVPTGSARRFRKVVIVCTVFNNLRPICFQICTHRPKSVTQSQCIAWKFCRGLARQAFCWCLLCCACRWNYVMNFEPFEPPLGVTLVEFHGEIFVSFLAERVYWISAVVQQGSEHFVTVCDNIFVWNSVFCTHKYEDEVQIQTCRWKWHACMFIQHYAKNWQSVQTKAKQAHPSH